MDSTMLFREGLEGALRMLKKSNVLDTLQYVGVFWFHCLFVCG